MLFAGNPLQDSMALALEHHVLPCALGPCSSLGHHWIGVQIPMKIIRTC